MQLSKNDIIRLSITDMTSDGNGVGRDIKNSVVFVPNTAIGDVIDARILKVRKNLAYAKVESIIEESADRIPVECKVASKCGGCVYRHISYSSELKIKHKKVLDAVVKIGKLDGSVVKPIIGAKDTNRDRYRNKAQIPIGLDKDNNVVMGFYSRHSHRIVDCDDCLLSPIIFSEIASTVKSFLSSDKALVYNESLHTGYIRHLYLRYAEMTDEVMVCFVVNGKSFPHQQELFNSIIEKYPQVKSIVINVNREKTNVILGKENISVYKKDSITDVLCGLKFELSALSFYQVNRTQAQVLYEKARQYAGLTPDDTLLDLYCGTGTIGLSMASDCKSLIGVELIDRAIANAKKNAENNNIKNAEFICADSEKAAEELLNRGIKPTVVIVDPPRKGLTPKLIETIAYMKPDRVVYVSCDPATLARDLNLFEKLHYSIKEITPIDLFPRTAHVESVCLMSRTEQ